MPLTIIIPTYNRPGYLKRILDYYQQNGCSYQIIVADSSSPEIKDQNRTSVAGHAGLAIRYLDSFSPTLNPWHKHPLVISMVSTKYITFCADDDFILLDGIKRGLEWLQTNPDYVAAHGQYYDFYLRNDASGAPQFTWRLGGYNSPSVTADGPSDRLGAHLADYTPTFYAVHRTAVAKIAYRALLDFDVDPILFGELLSSAITVMYGKISRLEYTHGFSNGSSPTVWPDLGQLRQEPSYAQKYAAFRAAVAHHLSQRSDLDPNQCMKIIDQAMSTFDKNNYSSDHRLALVSTARQLLPSAIYEAGRKFYRRCRAHNPDVLPLYQDESIGEIKKIKSLVRRDGLEIN